MAEHESRAEQRNGFAAGVADVLNGPYTQLTGKLISSRVKKIIFSLPDAEQNDLAHFINFYAKHDAALKEVKKLESKEAPKFSDLELDIDDTTLGIDKIDRLFNSRGAVGLLIAVLSSSDKDSAEFSALKLLLRRALLNEATGSEKLRSEIGILIYVALISFQLGTLIEDAPDKTA